METMIPRPEHPKPQFERSHWKNLNGEWAFEIDDGNSGMDRGLYKETVTLSGTILVPFCPESKLSGVEHKDFMSAVWYQRKVELKPEDLTGKVFLHFGAVDYRATVFVNGVEVGKHKGGYVSFRIEITNFVHEGENTITVRATDDSRDPLIPRGKQSEKFYSVGCDYTRTTGIWQTVWMEFVPKTYVDNVIFDGDVRTGIFTAKAFLVGEADLSMDVLYEGRTVGSVSVKNAKGTVLLPVMLSEIHLWEPGAGRLYDVIFKFGEDIVKSYYGLRSVQLDGYRFLINGKSVFQRLILDQGFYPDGIYTAPTAADLVRDIDMSMAMGFNGARLHEKIFEERFLYECDRKGYLVWGEYPNWGLDHTRPDAIYSILPEWIEEIKRDRNHPAIIGWCPFNETWNKHDCRQHDDLIRQVYRTTKAVDPTRPCIDTSGNYHVETDIFDVHDYNQDPVSWKANYDSIMETGELYDRFKEMESKGLALRYYHHYQNYAGEATMVSEYGGIKWTKEQAEREKALSADETVTNDRRVSWGYGKDVENAAEFKARFEGLTNALLDNSCMFGFCYTQLTDVEQEQNGLYTYDRVAKFDPAWVRSVVSRKAAIED